MVKPVYIYCDEGSSEIGVQSLLLAVEQYLPHPACLINAEQIIQGKLSDGCLLIMPGGADLPYCKKLNGEGNRKIRHFVEQGGAYLGICAGAYYGCAELDFIGLDYSVKGSRELSLFNGVAKGSLPKFTNGKLYDEGIESKAMVEITLAEGEKTMFYYHGGCCFEPTPKAVYRPLAYYPDGSLAMIEGNFGRGYYLLSGVHFELQAVIYQQKIVNCCEDREIKAKEETICAYFDKNYGLQVWQHLQRRLNQV
ncbi:BPL-N domain-containing protein [Mannheimia indoligenes]|uniref:BPL-N domain-containing protein n=1 Tax=Mannheimia indoligenes TaxID=3103145 RepID=UPI002FE6BC11